MKYFTKEEFRCSCGCGLGFDSMNSVFINKLDSAREYANTSFKINSSIRCAKHNKDEGGSKTSSHLMGLAVDISTPTSREKYKILMGLIHAGFNRFGIGSNFIHVDNDKDKPEELIWGY